jgi:NitT/TauT family transport system permease protein
MSSTLISSEDRMSTQDGVAALKAASPAPANGHSPAYQDYLRSLKRNGLKIKAWQLAILVVFLVVWEAGPRMGWINPMLTSYPSAVFKMSASLIADGSLAYHTWATFRSTVIGFVGGMLIGTTAAIALYLSPFLYRVLDPFIVVLNALPKIALVPLFFIWLGDMKSIYAMAIAISVFVTTLMLYTGFQAIDPDKVRLVKLFGASRWQVLTKVVLPGSVPTMISTLKINVGLSLVGVVVGEFQAAKAGLGYLITYGSQIFQMNLVMMSVVVLAIISTLMFGVIQALEAFIYRRRGLA